MREANPQYLKARDGLLSLMKSLPIEGLLPPERELCVRLNVSRGTLRSAIDELCHAGNLAKRPRQGTVVRWRGRRRNIGFLLGNCDGRPYFGWDLLILGGVVDTLAGLNVGFVPLIASKPEEKIPLLLRSNSLDGLLWIFPPVHAVKTLADANATGLCLAVVLSPSFARGENPMKGNFLAWDSAHIGRQRARFFIERGCERLAYFGDRGESFDCFREELRKAGIGFDMQCFFETPSALKSQLPKQLGKGGIDGIVSDGPFERYEALLETLATVRESKGCALLFSHSPGLDEALAANPPKGYVAISREDLRAAGAQVCRMLLRSIESGKEQEPEFIRLTLTGADGSIITCGGLP